MVIIKCIGAAYLLSLLGFYLSLARLESTDVPW